MKARERGDVGPAPVRAGFDSAPEDLPRESGAAMEPDDDVAEQRYEPRADAPVADQGRGRNNIDRFLQYVSIVGECVSARSKK
jgi:hypothetical protein